MTSITGARKVSGVEYPLNRDRLLFAELAQDELTADGYDVLGGYVSPVNDAYGKKVRTPLSAELLAIVMLLRNY